MFAEQNQAEGSMAGTLVQIRGLLQDFEALGGSLAAQCEPIPREALPPLCARLLAHEQDMTPMLESFHGDTISLNALKLWHDEQTMLREVMLVLDGTGEVVEVGTIRIHLGVFDADARRLILEARQPLGAILRDSAIPHHSRPAAFLRLFSNPEIERHFALEKPTELFGRCNRLTTHEGAPLAEVIEIIPPPQIKTGSNARG